MHGLIRLLALGSPHGLFCRFFYPTAFEGGNFYYRTSQLLTQLFNMYLVAVLCHHIHHIDRHNNRDPQFHKLGAQVEVTLNIGSIHNVENGLWAFAD